MCYECRGIDQSIGHYRQLEKLTTDRQTLDSIRILIAKLEADKKALHPDTAQTIRPPMHLAPSPSEAAKRPGFFRKRTSKAAPKLTAPPR